MVARDWGLGIRVDVLTVEAVAVFSFRGKGSEGS